MCLVKHSTLRAARDAKTLTQAQLAERSGVTQAHISKIEAGITVDPGHATVKKLETALSLPPGTLVFGDEAAV